MAHSFNVLIACMPLIPVKPYLAYLRNICLDSLILDTYVTTGHLTTKYAIWTFCIQMVFKDIIYKTLFFVGGRGGGGYRRKEKKLSSKKSCIVSIDHYVVIYIILSVSYFKTLWCLNKLFLIQIPSHLYVLTFTNDFFLKSVYLKIRNLIYVVVD